MSDDLVEIVPVTRWDVVCRHEGCNWSQHHEDQMAAVHDAVQHERGWHDAHGELAKVARSDRQAAVDRVVDAARKVEGSPLAGFYPGHVGGCIPRSYSDVSCKCGLSDLRFAIRALDALDIPS